MSGDAVDDVGAPAATRRRWPKLVAGLVAGLVALLALAAAGFVWWASSTPEPGSRAVAALVSDERVRVVDDDGYTFEPARPAGVGLVLYPGARVDPASYAAPARAIAAGGVLVVVPELTLNLAVLDASAAADVIAAHPGIETWVVGGHSLGGAMAAQFAHDRPEEVSGLLLWAAYPPDGADLSSDELAVASIYGTLDGLTTLDDIGRSRARLPPGTEFVAVEGGNHAQFGDYGAQRGDHPATISVEEQQAVVVEGSLRLLRRVRSD